MIARSTADERTQLHAYVVPEAGAPLDPQVLQGQLSTLLPEYMVPSAIVVLDRLPLNANGKVDRKALPSRVDPPIATRHRKGKSRRHWAISGPNCCR